MPLSGEDATQRPAARLHRNNAAPKALLKRSNEFRRIRRLKTTRPDASIPARLQEFLPRSIPMMTMSIDPFLLS